MATLDVTLLRAVNAWTGYPVWDGLFRFFTFIGTGGAVWVALAIVLLAGAGRLPGLRQKGYGRWRAVGLAVLVVLVFSGATESTLKQLIGRPRPPQVVAGLTVIGTPPDSYSFPSGHTLSSFAAAAVLFTATRRAARRGHPLGAPGDRWVVVAVAATIGFSRVFMAHHYPLDVLAGAAIGWALGWAAWSLFEWWMARQLDQAPRNARVDTPRTRVVD